MKQILLTVISLLISLYSWSQSGIVKGKLVDSETKEYLGGLEISLEEIKVMRFSNADGEFIFTQIPYGTYTLNISDGIKSVNRTQISVQSEAIDLGTLELTGVTGTTVTPSDQLATIGLEDLDASVEDDGVSNESFSSVLTATRDPYLSAAAYTFGPLRFQLRGYYRNQQKVYINYIPMNDPETGNAIWSQWGGLNEVFRNQNNTFALAPSEFGVEGLQGISGIDVTAASQRQQTRITYSLSNRSYRHRLMVTHSTGIMENGWAFSVSASRRYAGEGYIPGTFYDGYSYYVGASKLIGNKSALHFTSFGAPTKRGKAAPSIQEAMDIAGTNYYNSNWGWQDGRKRNAKVANTFMPTNILTFEHNKSALESLHISAAVQAGYVRNSTLDWYNAQDPRPDYYRKLPSYFIHKPDGVDSATYEDVLKELSENPDKMQVDWNRLYEANRLNQRTVNGVTGARSVYAIADDVDNVTRFSLSANYKRVLSENIKTFYGANYEFQHMESFREMLDLLGGDYWVNINQFAERTYIGNTDFNQHDMNNPTGIVRVGDKYMYHYKSYIQTANAWIQAVFNYDKLDFFIAGNLGYKSFQRDGMYKSGIFQGDSYGKSDNQRFLTFDVKGGVTYKIDGRNYIYANAAYFSDAPTFDNAFVAPRVRNLVVDGIKTEKSVTLEGGYLLHTPVINGRLSGFISDFSDITQIKRFYHEDYRTFVNYVMGDIGIRNMGMELAVQVKLTPTLSATGVAAYNQIFYTTRPNISVYRDNDTMQDVDRTVAYMKDYYVPAGPQSAYTLGLNYRSPRFWWASVNFNYMDRNYLEVNPTRLTEEATDMMDRSSEQFKSIVAQEQLPAFYTIDVSLGTSIMVNKYIRSVGRSHMLYLNLGINNVTNNMNVMTGGFNQLRYDLANRNPDRFPPKYFYGMGLNYFLNISYKF